MPTTKKTEAVQENVVDAQSERKTQLEELQKKLQKDYQDLNDKNLKCDEVINELEDRLLRQKEAKNVITASMIQIENTFKAAQAELQQIVK